MTIMEKVQDTLGAAKNAVADSSLLSNKKIAALQGDTVDGMQKEVRMTTDYGATIPEAANEFWLSSVSAERQGPQLLEDHIAREKINRFDHERIPERVVHARGSGAHGYFKLKEAIPELTSAGVLTDTSRTTPVFVRFSTVAGERGSADTVRDVRGFAVKFYTDEGNWDIVGNDLPVFFIQNAIKFPDLIHSVKPEPDSGVPQAQSAHNNFWDFAYQHPESTHMLMWAMSDRGIPRSLRMMQGFGVNTFTLINAEGKRTFVKFHFTPELGVHSLVWDEAIKLNGGDPDFHRKDLNEAIENGAFPKWDFGIQVVEEADQDKFEFDILDATKAWPEELIPVRNIGELVLDRVVDEYFTEVEQVAFNTTHIVPGIGFSNDPLLQGRNFSYLDTQLSRLGTNWQELPINRSVCPMMNNNRDGAMRHRITKGKANYYPNRFDATPPVKSTDQNIPALHEYHETMNGVKQRLQSEKFKEHFNQATMFWNSQSPAEKIHIINAFAFELDHCDDPIVYERMCERLPYIDLELAQAVAKKVGGEVPEKVVRPNHGKKSAAMSQTHFEAKVPTIKTRRVAIIVADGYDKPAVMAMKAALSAAGATPMLIGPRRSHIYAAGEEHKKGNGIFVDHHLEGQRSTMFDAIFIPPGAEMALTMRDNGRVIHWVREAFGHLKPIAAIGEAVTFLQQSVMLPGIELAIDDKSSKVVDSYGVTTLAKYESGSIKDSITLVKDAADFMSVFAYNISKHRIFEREIDGLEAKVAY